MSQTYFAILTAVGEAKLANATALGTQLQISKMAVGDGNGNLPTPNRSQTTLVNERYRANLNTLMVDPKNASQVVAEMVIPEAEGGYWLREMALYDAAGDMLAVSNCPPSYKPQMSEGSGRTQVLRMILVVSSSEAVQLKIDPSVVLATRDYVEKTREAAELYARNQLKAHTDAVNPHPQYLRRADVAKDAGPLAWLGAAGGTADALVLTLSSNESGLASYAAGQRFQFKASAANTGAVTAKVGGLAAVAVKKAGRDGLVDLAAGDISAGGLYDLNYDGAYFQLGGGVGSGDSVPVGAVLPFPMGTVPPGFLELDGSLQSAATYPDLAAYLGTAYNKGGEPAGFFRLPDSRGEFLRGWDHGRGADAGRALGSWQDSANRAHAHAVPLSINSLAAEPQFDPATWVSAPTFKQVMNVDSAPSDNGYAMPRAWANSGDAEARPRNLAVMWCIKAWSAPVNQGAIDMAALAAQVTQIAASMPKHCRSGFGMSINVASPGTTVDVAPGLARGSGNSVELLNPMSGVLQTSGGWSAGTGGNKLDTGARLPNSWYHRFILRRVTTGEADLLFSLSLAPAVPVGCEIIMRAGSVVTGGDGNIVPFIDVGRERFWSVPIKEGAGSYASSGAYTQTLTLTVPRGVRVLVKLQIAYGGAAVNMYLRPTDAQPVTINYIPDASAAALAGWNVGMTMNTYTTEQSSQAFEVLTDTSGSLVMQVYALQGFYSITSLGYIELD